MRDTNRRILPGFWTSLSFTLAYLTLIVLLPITACFLKASELSPEEFVAAVWNPRARAAYALTFGASLTAATINVPIGVLIAWVLARYRFPLQRLFDALVDLPLALPTAVAGLVYSNLYVQSGWLGRYLVPLGIHGSYSRLGIVLVLTFTGLPFVVRTVQPILENIEAELEEAAASLGATRLQTFWRVLLPAIFPAMVTGFALAFARGLGEYGSVIFVSGNMPFKTEIAPVLIVAALEEFNYRQAAAIATVLLGISLSLLFLINLFERWSARHAS
ncbi:MAG: sulfate ABC transporter permease [Candidatus Binatia bacterium]|nr:MAG: sulfate ABC transporter permease [Candidatus Binatia bacterium]